jgi:hypothetical protein
MNEFECSYNNMMEKLAELSHCVQQGRSHEAITANIDEVRKAATILRQAYNNRKDISVDVGFATLTAEPFSTNGDDLNGIIIGYVDTDGLWTQDLAAVSVENPDTEEATVHVWGDVNSEDFSDYFVVERFVDDEADDDDGDDEDEDFEEE